MATQLLLPDAVVTATNLTASIGNLDEGVSNFDGVYATNQALNSNTLLSLSFPTPSGDLNSGANLQTFRARVRKNATVGNTTTVRIEVRESGVIRANSTNTTVTSTTGVDISFTWDASVLASATGANVEIGIAQQAGGSGGNAANRRWIEVDTADWTADYTPPVVNNTRSFAVFV